MRAIASSGVRVYSTCPQSKDVPAELYAERVREVARWSEQAGCHGILVYTDNGILDPWLVAQEVLRATERLRPLVAVQPVYTHPYTVAKAIASLAYLHGRAVDLNWLAGGFVNDLTALGDRTPHDQRYARTQAYAELVLQLLRGERVTSSSPWHEVENLSLRPEVPPALQPGQLMSGSSPAGMAAATALAATAIRYPRPVDQEEQDPTTASGLEQGIRVGLIARETTEQAWAVALERFPADRRGQVEHQLAMKVSDSHWHRQLSTTVDGGEDPDEPYWLGPFSTGKSFCPYLVGSYARVADEVSRYLAVGFRTFVLDIPADAEELVHAGSVFARTGVMA